MIPLRAMNGGFGCSGFPVSYGGCIVWGHAEPTGRGYITQGASRRSSLGSKTRTTAAIAWTGCGGEALGLKREMHMVRTQTAWHLLNRLRCTLVRADCALVSGEVASGVISLSMTRGAPAWWLTSEVEAGSKSVRPGTARAAARTEAEYTAGIRWSRGRRRLGLVRLRAQASDGSSVLLLCRQSKIALPSC